MAITPPPIDPELIPDLAAYRASFERLSLATLADHRELAEREIPVDLTCEGRIRVREIPGQPALLVLSPANGTGPWPGIYYVHGGGMVMGTHREPLPLLEHVVAGAVVVSVDYRLAPEHPAPAPQDDTYAGLVWTAQHAQELQIDPDRLMIVGSSAGGGLAAGAVLRARDEGYPKLTHQVLYYPMLDDRMQTPSSQMLDGEGVWDRHDNLFGWTALLGDRVGGADVSPYSAPARAESLAGLPPTYIDVGECDTFRDEVMIYARRLVDDGVSTETHLWPGMYHGAQHVAPGARLSRTITSVRAAFLERALQPPGA